MYVDIVISNAFNLNNNFFFLFFLSFQYTSEVFTGWALLNLLRLQVVGRLLHLHRYSFLQLIDQNR